MRNDDWVFMVGHERERFELGAAIAKCFLAGDAEALEAADEIFSEVDAFADTEALDEGGQ